MSSISPPVCNYEREREREREKKVEAYRLYLFSFSSRISISYYPFPFFLSSLRIYTILQCSFSFSLCSKRSFDRHRLTLVTIGSLLRAGDGIVWPTSTRWQHGYHRSSRRRVFSANTNRVYTWDSSSGVARAIFRVTPLKRSCALLPPIERSLR